MFNPSNSSSSNHVPHTRRSSRSNSLSTSSVVTVKRAASLSSSNSRSTSVAPTPQRPSSPTEASAVLAKSPRKQRTASIGSGRRSSVAHVGSSSLEVREGVGNLNRWSQSTTSSKSSNSHARNGSFARRLSLSGSGSATSLHGSSTSPRMLARGRRSPSSSPHRSPPLESPPAMPALPSMAYLQKMPGNPKLNLANITTATSFTASTATPTSRSLRTPQTDMSQMDYFGDLPKASSSPQSRRPVTQGNTTAHSPLIPSRPATTESQTRFGEALRPSADHISQLATDRRPSTTNVRDHQRAPSQDRPSARRRAGSGGEGSGSHTRSRSDRSVHSPARPRERKEKDRKSMLSRALAKANTAVILDSEQNFEGAQSAYEDACQLLTEVLERSSSEDDKKKLESIRATYTQRIEELRQLDPRYTKAAGKDLPARPMSGESIDLEPRPVLMNRADESESEDLDDDEEPAIIETAVVTRIVDDPSPDERHPSVPEIQVGPSRSPGRDSILQNAFHDVEETLPTSYFIPRWRDPRASSMLAAESFDIESPMDNSYMPPPLSPRRPSSPNPGAIEDQDLIIPPRKGSLQVDQPTHTRGNSAESMSWLDTIDESTSSCDSSIRSASFHEVAQRKNLLYGEQSAQIEAEFDAAMDAAVEAAFDEGYEPYEPEESTYQEQEDFVAAARRKVDKAKERIREVEREEAILRAKDRDRELRTQEDQSGYLRYSQVGEYLDDEEAEEERMLDEMTREYMLDGFDFGLQSKSSLPRDSDSTGYSRDTWASSNASHRTTAGTSLSAVAEAALAPVDPSTLPASVPPPPSKIPPPVPPPFGALPPAPFPHASDAPKPPPPGIPGSAAAPASSVRNRRLSGRNPNQLKIETFTGASAVPPPPPTTQIISAPAARSTDILSAIPQSTVSAPGQLPGETNFKVPSVPASRLQAIDKDKGPLLPSPAIDHPSAQPPTITTHFEELSSLPRSGSPATTSKGIIPSIRTKKSSLSLKNRNMSVSNTDNSDFSANTPMSSTFSTFSSAAASKFSQPNSAIPLPTPTMPRFTPDGQPTGGIDLFDADIHSPGSPGHGNSQISDGPISLEPCPESVLLRPYWLMRVLYQTLAHPRGGYVTTKLFCPRDAWRVKGVKIKAMDEKVAQCDLLTAALLRLAEVDSNDADAVLEEMQALESVLDQVQVVLTKKLGKDVGPEGAKEYFEDVPDDEHAAPVTRTSNPKSYWRKLRSKNSQLNLSASSGPAGRDAGARGGNFTLPSIPMTNLGNVRFSKRDLKGVEFAGERANYMAALARLFDAAQVLDQVTRQAEDGGLKHSSSTHVGLELSSRHAAEFFGLYVVRFALGDCLALLDKFIKRGSEWVLQ